MDLACRPDRTLLTPHDGHELHVADMTATFGAGVSLAQAQNLLAAHEQWLPVTAAGERTLGELLEQNATGPLRLGYGGWRDLLLGVQFHDGRDRLITAGGRTVKNVAGYDLTKLMVGGRGVFGTVRTVTVRTYRRPAGSIVATFAPGRFRAINDLLTSPLRPQWAVLNRAGQSLGYLGDEALLAMVRQMLPAAGPSATKNLSFAEHESLLAGLWAGAGFRAALPPARVADAMGSVPATVQWAADAVFGVVVGDCDPGDRDALAAAVRAAGGSIGFPHLTGVGDERVRRLIVDLKREFDPDNRLTPVEAIL